MKVSVIVILDTNNPSLQAANLSFKLSLLLTPACKSLSTIWPCCLRAIYYPSQTEIAELYGVPEARILCVRSSCITSPLWQREICHLFLFHPDRGRHRADEGGKKAACCTWVLVNHVSVRRTLARLQARSHFVRQQDLMGYYGTLTLWHREIHSNDGSIRSEPAHPEGWLGFGCVKALLDSVCSSCLDITFTFCQLMM